MFQNEIIHHRTTPLWLHANRELDVGTQHLFLYYSTAHTVTVAF